MLKTYILKNGLKVATFEIPQMRSASLVLTVKAGSIFDNEKNSGVAHFMEHILFEGIPSFPNIELLNGYVENLAGYFNASTGSQIIRFTMNAPAKSLNDMLKIGSEIYFQPLFPEESIEKERNAVLEEIHQRIDTLWYKNWKFTSSIRYRKGHTMLLDGGGSEEAVQKLTRENLIDYWSAFFHPKNTYLVLVGGFNNTEVKKLIEQNFSNYDSGKKFIGYPNFTNKDFSGRKIAIRFDQTLKTCYLDLTFPSANGAENLSVEEKIVQTVLGLILGGLRNSRLYKLLRSQKGLVYGVTFRNVLYERFGYGGIETQAIPENVETVISLIVKEVVVFIKNGPTEEEINLAKSYHINRILMSFDTPQGVGGWIEGDLLWEDKIYTPEQYAKLIAKVDYKKIMSFMKKYWDLSRLNLTIQGPIKNSPANLRKFAKMIEELK